MPKDKSRMNLPDIKHLLTAGGLVAGTLGTLLLGAALQVDPQTVASEPTSVLTTPPVAGGSLAPARSAPIPAAPAPGTAAPVPTKVPPQVQPSSSANLSSTGSTPRSARPVSLADRGDDARRLLESDHEWTLQFMVTCNNELAASLIDDTGNDSRLYLLPHTMNDGRACFRICWDTFRSHDRAMAASNIPAALRKINAEPIARQLTDVAR